MEKLQDLFDMDNTKRLAKKTVRNRSVELYQMETIRGKLYLVALERSDFKWDMLLYPTHKQASKAYETCIEAVAQGIK